MGVRGLQTYVEKHCPPNVCKLISIRKMSSDHRLRFGCESILVVDGLSLANRLYSKSNLDWICGGQWLEFKKVIENFVSSFRAINVKLVCFFDGTVCSSKMQEWCKRRLTRTEEIATIFNIIRHGNHKYIVDDADRFQLPAGTGNFLSFALKELGVEVHLTDKEADDDIISFANRNEVFAILSQDSDFIICNTKSYLSLHHLNLNTLETMFYDRDALASHLQLQVHHLPLFACLAGNHFLTSETLRDFHRRLIGSNRIFLTAMAPSIACFIQQNQFTGNFDNNQELQQICRGVFGHLDYVQLLRDGLKSYIVNSTSPDLPFVVKVHPDVKKVVYEKFQDCSMCTHLLNLLCKLQYSSSEVLEDGSILPSALVYRPIRQRCYCVLFNSHSSSQYRNKKVAVNEWCSYPGNRLQSSEVISPLPLDLTHTSFKGQMPAIEEIWFHSTNQMKMEILWAVLKLPMSLDKFLNQDVQHRVLTSILNYLINDDIKPGPFMEPWVVAVFVSVALKMKNVPDSRNIVVERLDPTALNLTTVFMRGVTAVQLAINVCGDPIPMKEIMPWRFFDGKLFHILYNEMKKNMHIRVLCNKDKSSYADFYKLLGTCVEGTRYAFDKTNWVTIINGFHYL